jgi:hypothetical protein
MVCSGHAFVRILQLVGLVAAIFVVGVTLIPMSITFEELLLLDGNYFSSFGEDVANPEQARIGIFGCVLKDNSLDAAEISGQIRYAVGLSSVFSGSAVLLCILGVTFLSTTGPRSNAQQECVGLVSSWSRNVGFVVGVSSVSAAAGLGLFFRALWIVIEVKFPLAELAETCALHGWEYSHADPRTGAGIYVNGTFANVEIHSPTTMLWSVVVNVVVFSFSAAMLAATAFAARGKVQKHQVLDAATATFLNRICCHHLADTFKQHEIQVRADIHHVKHLRAPFPFHAKFELEINISSVCHKTASVRYISFYCVADFQV